MEYSILLNIRNIAISIAFSLLVCGVALSPALADEHHHGHDEHHEVRHHGHERYHGGYAYAPAPNYYYAPQPNYYYAPEPDQYYYSTQPAYPPPPPSEGINLFFGIH